MFGWSTAQNKDIRSLAKRSPVVRPEQVGRPPNALKKGRKAGRLPIISPERAGRMPDERSAEGELEAIIRPNLKDDRRILIESSNY